MSVFTTQKGTIGGTMGTGPTQKTAPMPVSAKKADNIRTHSNMSPSFSNQG